MDVEEIAIKIINYSGLGQYGLMLTSKKMMLTVNKNENKNKQLTVIKCGTYLFKYYMKLISLYQQYIIKKEGDDFFVGYCSTNIYNEKKIYN